MRRLALAFKSLFGRNGEVFSLQEAIHIYTDSRREGFEAGYKEAIKEYGIQPSSFYERVEGDFNGVEVQLKRKQ